MDGCLVTEFECNLHSNLLKDKLQAVLLPYVMDDNYIPMIVFYTQ